VMDALLVGAIEALHDPARREAVLEREQAERDRLADAIREAVIGE
jgi:hypothetical protein